MAWDTSVTWWIATGVLVAAELGSGTFYLLMLALGAACGALAAHLGFSGEAQAVVAGLVGVTAVTGWHLHRRRRVVPPPAANRDVNLDVGERVQVAAWHQDGTARVQYRGAAWNARHAGKSPAVPGEHVIVEVRHNELLLRRA